MLSDMLVSGLSCDICLCVHLGWLVATWAKRPSPVRSVITIPFDHLARRDLVDHCDGIWYKSRVFLSLSLSGHFPPHSWANRWVASATHDAPNGRGEPEGCAANTVYHYLLPTRRERLPRPPSLGR
ncbi:hypothetical protein GGS24DRAFT_469052 [Hypoxylon argillaceum]|nr:hypothetical protein GGS24DRAFT_469052 [Hypoxylon argillaceum]